MHPEISKLLQVQELEVELITLKGQAEAISIPLERTRARRHATRKDLVDAQEKLDRTVKERRGKERDLADAEQKLALAQERLSTAQTAREAQVHEAETERAKAAAAAAEDAALGLLEQEEHQTGVVEKTAQRIARDLEVIDTEMQRLEALMRENQTLAKGLREERIAAVNRLEASVRGNYDWLLNRYGPGQTIAHTKGAACGGCGSMLLPDQVMKVHDLENLHRCTHCARYLLG